MAKTQTEYVEMPQPLGLFAGDLFSRGVEYLEAFEELTKRKDEKYLHASYFLFSHSLELLLKSFLTARGFKKNDIRKRPLSHDLPEIMRQCELKSIPHVSNLSAFVSHTFEMNRDFDFRYPSRYRLSMPRPAECALVARALVVAIEPIISRAAVEAQLQFASETRKDRGKKVRWSD